MTDESRVYYAIGDIHGMAERLVAMHDVIRSDIATLGNPPATIVHLGDYIDRGPDSRGVIAAVMALEAEVAPSAGRYAVVALRGNHEQMMLDAVGRANPTARRLWTANGGETALDSYRRVQTSDKTLVDPSHLRWMRRRPLIHRVRERKLVFVHAGIDPEAFPECQEQVYLWTRSARFFNTDGWPDRPELQGLTVVHGHTPTNDFAPEIAPRRINVDTGAVFGGPLTCVALAPDVPPRFLYT